MIRFRYQIVAAAFVVLGCLGLAMSGLAAQEPQEINAKSSTDSPDQPNRQAANQMPQFQSVREVNRYFDHLKIQALADYVSSGDRPDAEGAYLTIFNAVIEHDLYIEFEKVAQRYIKDRPEGSVTPLARAVTAMALANRSDFQRATKTFSELLAEIDPQNTGFAWSFGDSLARLALTAGDYASTRQIYGAIEKKFPNDGDIKGQVQAQLARIELVGKPAPAFSATDIHGKTITLDDYRNKVTLLDFWATWCRPCVAELPAIQAVYDRFHSRGFDVIGISLDENSDAVREFLAENKLPWRQIVNGSEKEQNIVVKFGVDKIPATFLIDGSGKIQRLDLRGENLERAVESLLIKTATKPEGVKR